MELKGLIFLILKCVIDYSKEVKEGKVSFSACFFHQK